MNYILRDYNREYFLPFTFTRPVSEIRMGILTIREKWEKYLGKKTSFFTENYLSGKYPLITGEKNCVINSCIIPDKKLIASIKSLKKEESLTYKGNIVAYLSDSRDLKPRNPVSIEYKNELLIIENLWDIFQKNERALIDDFALLTKGKKSQKLSASNKITGRKNIFIEKGAKAEHAFINAIAGPVYISKDAEVMEGCMIRGPFSLGEHSTLKMGAKIYGATTIGPHCKVGGEVSNSVIFGYSNKAHDGFLGNSVISEWCNLGADTNNSNLKNNYGEISIWSFAKRDFIKTGLKFCGLFMGDHSKSGINTMFNTGTVTGVCTNIFGSDFPPRHIPSFSWGGEKGFEKFKLEKAFETAQEVFHRRGLVFDEKEKAILKHLFNDNSR